MKKITRKVNNSEIEELSRKDEELSYLLDMDEVKFNVESKRHKPKDGQ